MIFETNVPVPVPFVVLLLDVVGLPVVFQQTPLDVIVAPPSEDIVAPEVAVVYLTKDISAVEIKIEVDDRVVRVTWLPYAVPAVLVA